MWLKAYLSSTSECVPSGGWLPGLQLGLQQGIDVVGQGLALCWWAVCVCQLVRLLSDVVVVITQPFLAAAAPGPGQPGPPAAPVRQGHLVRAEGHAAHHPIHAGALVLAVGLEVFAVLVYLPAELTGETLGLGCHKHTAGRGVRRGF